MNRKDVEMESFWIINRKKKRDVAMFRIILD